MTQYCICYFELCDKISLNDKALLHITLKSLHYGIHMTQIHTISNLNCYHNTYSIIHPSSHIYQASLIS